MVGNALVGEFAERSIFGIRAEIKEIDDGRRMAGGIGFNRGGFGRIAEEVRRDEDDRRNAVFGRIGKKSFHAGDERFGAERVRGRVCTERENQCIGGELARAGEFGRAVAFKIAFPDRTLKDHARGARKAFANGGEHAVGVIVFGA